MFFSCFSSVFWSFFTANFKIFAVKMNKKWNEKQVKNSYCEPPPPQIPEKQMKNGFHAGSAPPLPFNSVASSVTLVPSPHPLRTLLPMMPCCSICKHWTDGITEAYSKQQSSKLERELKDKDSASSMSENSDDDLLKDLNNPATFEAAIFPLLVT